MNVGHAWTAPAGMPPHGGVLEYLASNPYDALLLLEQPVPGVAALGVFDAGGPTMVALNVYLYGDQAAASAAAETPLWQAWMQARFPVEPETIEGA